jgi:flagellar basal-body rod modification protein FlgD
MFLELLVAQIKNQDPLSPADPTQFTSQLAQFSELEQVIAIRGDIEKSQSAASATPPASTASSPATPQS